MNRSGGKASLAAVTTTGKQTSLPPRRGVGFFEWARETTDYKNHKERRDGETGTFEKMGPNDFSLQIHMGAGENLDVPYQTLQLGNQNSDICTTHASTSITPFIAGQ